MKEMPERIYLFDCNDAMIVKLEGDTEYIRTDAFIEKACDAYCKVCGHYPHIVPTHIYRHDCDYYKDFKKHLEEQV